MESTCGVVANVMDCDIIVSQFEFKSCYYVPFGTNNLRKDKKFSFHLPIG